MFNQFLQPLFVTFKSFLRNVTKQDISKELLPYMEYILAFALIIYCDASAY